MTFIVFVSESRTNRVVPKPSRVHASSSSVQKRVSCKGGWNFSELRVHVGSPGSPLVVLRAIVPSAPPQLHTPLARAGIAA